MSEPGLLQVILLALVQGVTEFLPISSSAHLILVPLLFGWPDQGLAFDVALHMGTLAAVLWYFRKDLGSLWSGWWGSLRGRGGGTHGRLAWGVLVGTLPAGVAGLLLGDWVEEHLRGPLVIATATLCFGLLLWFADYRHKEQRTERDVTWTNILVIGFAQAIALIPGTSRSGITMTAGLLTGLGRQGAARFSFLLSIPVIGLAGLLEATRLITAEVAVDPMSLMLGVGLSALSGYLCIDLLIRLLPRVGMLPFVVYRLLLGVTLFVLFR